MVNPDHLVPLDGVVFRITDRQGYQATERWTRNLAEQARLEALITRVKPPMPDDPCLSIGSCSHPFAIRLW